MINAGCGQRGSAQAGRPGGDDTKSGHDPDVGGTRPSGLTPLSSLDVHEPLHITELCMSQGNKKLGIGMILGLMAGMLLYRVLFG